MLHDLRLAYFTPEASRDAGFIETDHFGVRFPERGSHFDLTGIAQRWLRDLLWDYLADLLRSPDCPRSGGTFDAFRRAATELGAFLAVGAPGGGHDPALLTAAHIQRFAADQRHREREGLASLAMRRQDGTPSIVTTTTRAITFNHARKLLRWALDCGAAERTGLSRQFITAMPAAGPTPVRKRSPFPDEVARALADEASLARLAEVHDPADFGLRDIWETIIVTGRRVSEVLRLRLDCTGRYGGLAMLWHDQTKVGRYDQAIRIPESLFRRLAARRETTVSRFIARHGRAPTAAEREAMALFPGRYRNPDGTAAVTYQWFHLRFKAWVDELDIGRWVPHQARHTLATSLLRHGATLTHIRRYLGHVSDRMAEHYIQLSHSDLEDVLQHVWVAGPGTPSPGTLLSGPATPITREQAQALAIDLSRRSTPAEGGFCTFQPVVDGGACPWNLDCHNCANFVLSGADLLYWRRKREQWYSIAERAPDDATASWLHEVFAPTAAAIDGLEAALAGLGLLDDALCPGPAPAPGLLPAGLEHRLPRHRARQRLRRRGPHPRRPAGRGRRRAGGNSMTPDRTAAAIQARRRAAEQKLQQVRDAVASLRRHKTPVTYPAVARQAGVSRTFLYANPDARALISDAISKTGTQHRPGARRRSGAVLAGTRAQRRGGAEDSRGRDRRSAAPHGHPPGPDPRPGTRPVTGGSATAGHREHHAQAARPPAHPRQPDPGRPAGSRPLQQPLRRPAHRPARSPAHRARPSPLTARPRSAASPSTRPGHLHVTHMHAT